MRKEIKPLLFLFYLFGRLFQADAQNVYTIKADSVKLTGCDSSELIIENHTQNIPGFLFNTGNGRTIFKRGAFKLNDSLYIVGADTLNLGARAWLQGGNAFGTTGVLGTLDNNHLDLYTNNQQRARLTNTGNFLLGTTTDNGNLLQVNGGASFSGDVNIGSATITHTGNLIGTNAILFEHVVSQFHSYQGNDIYVSKLDNVLYNYQARFATARNTGPDGTVTIDMVIPPDELSYPGIIYPQGKMCFSFWNGGIPQSVSVRLFDNNQKLWFGPYTTTTNLNTLGAGYFEIGIPGAFNYVNEITITITPPSGGWINLQNIEYVLSVDNEGLVNAYPFVGKTDPEHIYNYFYLKNGGIDNVRLSPTLYAPNYFLNNVLIGATTDNGSGSKLQVTGGMTATGAIQLSGLTGNNSAPRVLASDESGNLYYRDASSLAANEAIRASLAVNGPIRAKKLTLEAKDWPDYVFDSSYGLPALSGLETFIRQQHHLPGMPAAAEVQREGVDVGATQAALLKKIEELTLYTIAQEKEMTLLKEEVSELKRLLKK